MRKWRKSRNEFTVRKTPRRCLSVRVSSGTAGGGVEVEGEVVKTGDRTVY